MCELSEVLLEITDYDYLELSESEADELTRRCAKWEDKESIESEVNIYIQSIGYTYDDEKFAWVNK